jgi:hypothetical protein
MLSVIKTGISSAQKVIMMNMPGILTGLAVAGVGATGYTAFKAGMECKEVIDEKGLTKENWKEGAKELAPIFVKPVVVGMLTATCMVGSTTLSQRRQAALASMLALSEKDLKDIDSKIRSEYGDKKAEKLHDDINEDRVKANPPESSQIIVTGNGESLCYDSLTGRYFKSDIETIRRVINTANQRINAGEYISVNDYCDLIGLPDSDLGWDLGWGMASTGLIDVRFTSCISTEGQPVLVIEHKVKPEVKYDYDM